MVNFKKWILFFAPEISVLGQKIRFFPFGPNFGRWPICIRGVTVHFPPWDQFFDFPLRSYSCFRKKIWLTAQKVFPLPTLGAPSASNSPSALSGWKLSKICQNSMKKWPFFAIFLPWMASSGSNRSFRLIFSARDDLVKVSWKSDARRSQNQVTLLTLTSWVKGISPFGLWEQKMHRVWVTQNPTLRGLGISLKLPIASLTELGLICKSCYE